MPGIPPPPADPIRDDFALLEISQSVQQESNSPMRGNAQAGLRTDVAVYRTVFFGRVFDSREWLPYNVFNTPN